MGSEALAVNPSMAWVKASMPVDAVSSGGMVRVISGSTSATFGAMRGSLILNLNFSLESVITELKVTSLPVPAVVGMAINGSTSAPILWGPS